MIREVLPKESAEQSLKEPVHVKQESWQPWLLRCTMEAYSRGVQQDFDERDGGFVSDCQTVHLPSEPLDCCRTHVNSGDIIFEDRSGSPEFGTQVSIACDLGGQPQSGK